MFNVGDKVVCVDNTPSSPRIHRNNRAQLQLLTVGRCYTVRRLIIAGPGRHEGKLAFHLNEIHAGIHTTTGRERGYIAERFRKIEGDREAWDALMAAAKPRTVHA